MHRLEAKTQTGFGKCLWIKTPTVVLDNNLCAAVIGCDCDFSPSRTSVLNHICKRFVDNTDKLDFNSRGELNQVRVGYVKFDGQLSDFTKISEKFAQSIDDTDLFSQAQSTQSKNRFP